MSERAFSRSFFKRACGWRFRIPAWPPGLAAMVRYGISVSHAAIKAIPPYGASFPFDLPSEGAQGAGWFACGRI